MPLTLYDVGHRFGDQPWLFRGVTLEFEPDRVYALVGPSGSGKSTLLAAMSRQLTPTEGRVDVQGSSICVFQNPVAPAARTVRDIAAFPLLARGHDRASAYGSTSEFLERFRLTELSEKPFHTLSGGQAQRLMIARGIAADPDVLLIDEPTAQLDTATSRTVSEVITGSRGPSRIVVVATHDAAMVEQCTDILDLRAIGADR